MCSRELMTPGAVPESGLFEPAMTPGSHVSLFTGAGGLDLGIEKSGFATLAAVEIDQNARETLELNRTTYLDPDFALFRDASKISGQELLSAIGLRRGYLDLLSGGPPCQAFSTAGNRQSIRDPRGSLIAQYLKLVAELEPRFFILENVRGVLSAALKHRPISLRGPGHPPLTRDERVGSLLDRVILPWITKRLGYQVAYGLINAADYGTPQLRQRVIFVGSREHEFPSASLRLDLGHLLPATHSNDPDSPLMPWVTLGMALKGLSESNAEYQNYSPAREAVLERVPAGRNWRFLRDEFGEEYAESVMGGAYRSGGGKVGFWRRLSFDKPSPTLVTSPLQKATSLCHPEITRPLSVQEYARIQQFPDDYLFAGATSSKYLQIGNAVPVGLGYAIGSFVASTMCAEGVSNQKTETQEIAAIG